MSSLRKIFPFAPGGFLLTKREPQFYHFFMSEKKLERLQEKNHSISAHFCLRNVMEKEAI